MAKIHIITFGCTLNQADSELMAGLLKEAGHTLTKTPEDADLIIINSCTVKEQAENKLDRKIHEVSKAEDPPRIVIAGCVAQAQPGYRFSKYKEYSILGTKQLNKISHVVQETLDGNIVHLLDSGTNQRFNLPVIRRNEVIGIIPIAEGCLGNCTYCKARFARGTLQSYPIKDIIDQMRFHLSEGCKEIWLTAQDCGAYGNDIGTDLPTLLREALEIKGDHKIRLGMVNPQYALEFFDELIDIYKRSPNLFRFVHIPVQAGSNRILKLMNRKYSKEDFVKVCETLREEIPDITIATDVICGFPSETDDEFQETLDLIGTIKPDVLNRSRFWPRPGTVAATLPGQLHGRDTNARSRMLQEMFTGISAERNRYWIGRTCTVIVDERGAVGDKESWIARNGAYKPVGLHGSFSPGNKVEVRITKAATHHLESEIIE